MAIASLLETASLLEPPKFRLSSLKFHHLSSVSSPTLFPFSKLHHQIRFTPHSSLHPNLRALAPRPAVSQSTEEDLSNPLDKLLNAILKTLNLLKKPAIVAIFLGVLILGHPFSRALAASGGSIGGDSWSSSDSSSSYSSSSSSSSWSLSSDDDYDSDTTPSCTSSSSDSSRKKSKKSSDNNKTSSSSDDYETSSSSDSSQSNSETTPSYSSSSSSPVVPTKPVASSSFKAMSILISMVFAVIFFYACTAGRVVTQPKKSQPIKTTVIKLQVCLLGSARSFQRDLDQLAEKADTSTKAGLCYVLTEATSSLLRHTDSCISAYSSLDSVKDAQKLFNQLSIEERAKFDEETLVNLNNIKRQTSVSHSSSSFSNEYIVATILVAAEGVDELPAISSSSDLKIALQKLGSISSSKLRSVQVLWTPQKEGDRLSESKVLEDYPLLRPLKDYCC
ncbi:myelin-associated oligodendrocyte basic protein [Rhynchospora pubera]|uniref:Myelin-associated oligodendrocyte basic protein n=1 Tax=Rhynchospora pubera TaxID=906938 RepID=A0AAV8HK88_9POAL|nr:myelin-associated oligodendrocyte basic protein [Rhynchospora pubera]